MAFCSSCGAKITEDMKDMEFCIYCGQRMKKEGKKTEVVNRALIIKRELQFLCFANGYRVIVDGINYGNLGAGKTIVTTTTHEEALVDIICTTVGVNAKLRIKLKLKENPMINIKLTYPGDISATIVNADIIEQTNQF